MRAPSLEGILFLNRGLLTTTNKSTLSYALRRMSVVKVARDMVELLNSQCQLNRTSIVIIDSMAVTLPRTQQGNCAKYNKNTMGGGVMWQFCVNAPNGASPLRILKFMHGAWNDCFQIRDCPLICDGPLYIMDRGFYSLVTMGAWLGSGVRFLVRGKASQCHYEVIKLCGAPRKVKNVHVETDAIALVGKDEQTRVKARLVWCKANGTDLILVSSELEATAENLLELYRKRWDIERFHKIVKHVLGLAHLYSFQGNGLELLLYTSFLLAVLLYMSCRDGTPAVQDLVKCLRLIIQNIHKTMGVTVWKTNVYIQRRVKKRRRTNH